MLVKKNNIADTQEFFPLVEGTARRGAIRRLYANTAHENNLAYEYCRQEGIEPVIKSRLNAVGGRDGPRGKSVSSCPQGVCQ
jgi:hypothetical protein